MFDKSKSFRAPSTTSVLPSSIRERRRVKKPDPGPLGDQTVVWVMFSICNTWRASHCSITESLGCCRSAVHTTGTRSRGAKNAWFLATPRGDRWPAVGTAQRRLIRRALLFLHKSLPHFPLHDSIAALQTGKSSGLWKDTAWPCSAPLPSTYKPLITSQGTSLLLWNVSNSRCPPTSQAGGLF